MSLFRQIAAVTAMNVRSIPRRLGSSSVVVIGLAGVVGVLVTVMGMSRSLTDTLVQTGRDDRAIVLRNGARAEVSSSIDTDAVQTIMDAPGVVRAEDGSAAASADVIVAVNLLRRQDGTRAGLTVRGTSSGASALRPEVEIVEGRMFEPGLRELIIGRGAQREFQGTDIGDVVGLRDSDWTVVGTFESGDAHESGFLTDTDTLLSAYQRTAPNAVTVLLESPAAFEPFKAHLTTNPTLSVEVLTEREYYLRQSSNAGNLLDLVTNVVSVIMAVGAVFAALNTMYTAVSSRAVEIATLRALGFGAGGVVVSVLVEALLLAVAGALLGASAAWLFFSGNTISMGGGVSSNVFVLSVTPGLLATGIVWACVVGLLGGLLPAIRAARLPVATALRAL